jgi:hypothetical protein
VVSIVNREVGVAVAEMNSRDEAAAEERVLFEVGVVAAVGISNTRHSVP